MKNLAPELTRQRLLIEGFYGISVDESVIRDYFKSLTAELGLKAYGEPTIFSPGGLGKTENQGYDAFIPLVDSGIALYVWGNVKFLSCVIYTCKSFDEEQALAVTKKFFNMAELAFQRF